ncbi:hypothetical protein PIB30_096861, partial [Stylosanthes scabra]|nr:hypothetical protein [Stylosanthes scabra]
MVLAKSSVAISSSQSCSAVLTGSCLYAPSICLNNRRRLHKGATSDTGFSIEEATGIVSSAIAYYAQGLVLQSKGPVFLTAFNPLCMIIVSILGYFLLSETLHLGRFSSESSSESWFLYSRIHSHIQR